MEAPRLHDLLERMQRRFVAEAREVRVQIVLELVAAAALSAPRRVETGDFDRVDHLRADVAQLADRTGEHTLHFAVERRRVVRLMEDAEPRAFESIRAERVRIARCNVIACVRRDGISGIRPGDHLKHGRRIGDRARDSAGDVGREVERHDAAAADEPHGRSQADERLMTRGSANRIAGVAGETDRREACRDAGRGAAARPGSHAARVVRIARVAGKNRIHRLDRAERELRHVRLRDHHRARVAQAFDDEGVLAGHHAFQRQRSGGRRHVDRLVVVFDEDRHAVQRSNRSRLAEAAIEIVRDLQRVVVHLHDGVERGAFLVVRVDALQVLLDERAAGQRAAANRRLDLRDGGFVDAERRGWLRGERDDGQKKGRADHEMRPHGS